MPVRIVSGEPFRQPMARESRQITQKNRISRKARSVESALIGDVRRVRRKGESAAPRRTEGAFVKKKLEEWWECPNQGCGTEILFLMLGSSVLRAAPTCFCGSPMERAGKPKARRHSLSGRQALGMREVATKVPASKLEGMPVSKARLAGSWNRRG